MKEALDGYNKRRVKASVVTALEEGRAEIESEIKSRGGPTLTIADAYNRSTSRTKRSK